MTSLHIWISVPFWPLSSVQFCFTFILIWLLSSSDLSSVFNSDLFPALTSLQSPPPTSYPSPTSIHLWPLFAPDLYSSRTSIHPLTSIWPQSTSDLYPPLTSIWPLSTSDLYPFLTTNYPWPPSTPDLYEHLTSIHPLTSIWPLSTPWPLSDLYLTSIPPPLDGEYPPLPAGCRLEGETDRTQQTDTGIHTIYTVLKLNILICICIATEWNIYL